MARIELGTYEFLGQEYVLDINTGWYEGHELAAFAPDGSVITGGAEHAKLYAEMQDPLPPLAEAYRRAVAGGWIEEGNDAK